MCPLSSVLLGVQVTAIPLQPQVRLTSVPVLLSAPHPHPAPPTATSVPGPFPGSACRVMRDQALGTTLPTNTLPAPEESHPRHIGYRPTGSGGAPLYTWSVMDASTITTTAVLPFPSE
jgi:hypothetical protein